MGSPRNESEAFECLKYMHEKCNMMYYISCLWAAQAGFLKCLRLVPSPSSFITRFSLLLFLLMSLNYIDRYAHENGCGWDPRTCEYAAKRGHLECLKYVYPPFLLFQSLFFLFLLHIPSLVMLPTPRKICT